MSGIFQRSIPHDITPRALPGIGPLDEADWLQADEAFAGQMAERERLLSVRRDEVLAMTPQGLAAADELLNYVLDWLGKNAKDYQVSTDQVRRPDGVSVTLDRGEPMATLGHLVQEDFCLLEKHGDEHVMTAAVLCFPASWRLADKIGRPLGAIHDPVEEYDETLARRVQRLFDGVQVGRPMWRFNLLHYADPALFQPKTRTERGGPEYGTEFPYLRSERQSVLRLPKSLACVFSIHTYVVPRAAE